MQMFVERVQVGAIDIDVYATANAGSPSSGRYLIYHEGTCVNRDEPFRRCPDTLSIAAFLRGDRSPIASPDRRLRHRGASRRPRASIPRSIRRTDH
jgi:hypothetical protein